MTKRECPKCSKLYVQEKAFRKHVSSCRRTTKISKRGPTKTQPSWASGRRKFNGLSYMYVTSFRAHGEAQMHARTLRNRGVNARVVKGAGWSTKTQKRVTMWRVYGRKSKKRKGM